jgi:RNA polymerase sigma-70 factor (ECF subfamily)
MVQECFLRAFRKLPTLREPSRFGAWVAGIARQVGRERRRFLRRDRHEFREPGTWEIETATNGQAPTIDRDSLELVMRQLVELDERDRLAIHAFFLEEQGAAQVAEILGLSRSGMYALLKRALSQLAAAVGPGEIREASKRGS